MFSERAMDILKSKTKYPLAKSAREVKPEELIKLCSNESPIGPSPKVIEALKREAENVREYPDSSSTELKKLIGKNLNVNPDMICMGNGSDEIMDLICKTFIDPGDKCLIPIPTFSMYEIASRVNLGKPKFVELPNFQWETDILLREFRESKLAFICRPNNPTGNSIQEEGLLELLETGKPVIVDEAYTEFTSNSAVSLIKSYENLLILRTFSKAFGLAGLRIGYSIGNSEVIKALEVIRSPFNVNILAQTAARVALKDKGFIKEVKNMVFKGKKYIQEELSKLEFNVLPSETNFLMIGLDNIEEDASTICNYLNQKGIIVRDLTNFRGAGSNWIRITVGKPDHNDKLINTLKEFKKG